MIRKLRESSFDVARESYNNLREQSSFIEDLCTSIKAYAQDIVTDCLAKYDDDVNNDTITIEDYIDFLEMKEDAIEQVVSILKRANSLLSSASKDNERDTLGLSESINTEDPRKLWADKMGVNPKLLRTSSSGKGTVITISALNMFEIYGKGLTNKDIENAGNEVIEELGLDGECYITDLGNYNGAKLKYN